MDAPRVRSYSAGMPQLSYAGLSENWLLKECGDLHWERLAQAHGMARPDFRDVSGKKAYAAFTAVRLSAAGLDTIAENDVFQIQSGLTPAGRAQFFSRHTVRGTGSQEPVATVEMLSAFVFRQALRNNRSVGRAAIGVDEHWRRTADSPSEDDAERYADLARTRRKAAHGMPLSHGGGVLTAQPDFVFSPCPNNDFNGANFMYFANFPAWIDRAEWRFFRPDPLLTVVSRDVFYHGNVNVGEDVVVRCLSSTRAEDGDLSHRCGLFRAQDGMLIADVHTRKRPARLAMQE